MSTPIEQSAAKSERDYNVCHDGVGEGSINIDLEKGLVGSQSTEAAFCCNIERVPGILRQIEAHKECFTPLLIAFGPYHHCSRNYERGEELKIQFMEKFCKDKGLVEVKAQDKVKAVVSQVRTCYSTTHTITDTDFARMMFLDGCTILQFIYCYSNKKWNELKIKPYEISLILHDLFLLENQVPFLVLKQLLQGDEDEIKKMLDNFVREIRPVREAKQALPLRIMDFFNKNEKARKTHEDEQPMPMPMLHLLDSLWKHVINENGTAKNTGINEIADDQQQKDGDKEEEHWYTFRSAKELKASGILFSHSKTSNFRDVNYYKPFTLFPFISYLCIPPITVDDSTKSLLLNLASHEMSSTQSNTYPVCSYICFMDSLIDSKEDVTELRKRGVVFNCLGSDQEVADLFNDLATHLVADREAYRPVKKQIDEHYRNPFTREINHFLYTHFRNPWAILVFFGALAGLVMTFIQTYSTLRRFAK